MNITILFFIIAILYVVYGSNIQVPRRLDSWMDHSLPLPISIHTLEHHKHNNHQNHPNLHRENFNNKQNKYFRKLDALGSELTPLFPGYGTHYSYIYVGTPPQRQSVIIDTGSHFTAFPCKGCSQCGQHTDSYWDPDNSTTVIKCTAHDCVISQSYTEGSSWRAVKITDKLWVGGAGPTLIPHVDSYAVDFMFGCQSSETGLFRTQLADGIMGMSIGDDTLPNQLVKQGVAKSKIFALCFRVGGGIMTLGGVDQRLNSKNGIRFVEMQSKSSGWFGVKVLDIILTSEDINAKFKSVPLGADSLKCNIGKGTIVDSGTTDTYLPAELSKKFSDIFKKVTGGIVFTSGNIKLSKDQLQKLPTITLVLEGLVSRNSSRIEINMPWSSYVDSLGDDMYSFRVYLTEKEGAVLGANFMNGYNVVFDQDGKRVGFAKSSCNYEEYTPPLTETPTKAPVPIPGKPIPPKIIPVQGHNMSIECALVAYSQCTARCDRNVSAYASSGKQMWASPCNPSDIYEARDCSENCSYYSAVRGDPRCPDRGWSDCTHGCVQSKSSVPLTEPLLLHNKCNYRQQTSTCYYGSCPIDDGDYLIYIDMRVRISPWQWSYVYTEAFANAFKTIFKLKSNSVELLNDAGTETATETKLHFQIRIRAKDYKGSIALHNAAENIAQRVQMAEFGLTLSFFMQDAMSKADEKLQNRFGWMSTQDIKVLNAVAVPIGGTRDIDNKFKDGGSMAPENDDQLVADKEFKANMFLLGVALTITLLIGIILYLNHRLRQQHYAYQKDKSRGSGEVLRRMWERFSHDISGNPSSKLSSKQKEEMEMSQMGLLHDNIHNNANLDDGEEHF
eukprot:gene7871-10685_t